MGRKEGPKTMEGFRRADKDIRRGEKEQSRVGRQLPFQVLKERGEVFGVWVDRYTCHNRVVREYSSWLNGRMIPKCESKSRGGSKSHLCVHTVKKRSSLCCRTFLPLDKRDSKVP